MKKLILSIAAFLVISGCSPEAPERPDPVQTSTGPTTEQFLDIYANALVTATDQNIFDPTPATKTGDKPMLSYVIKFHTADPALMSKDDGDTNQASYAFNSALTEAWGRRFCTKQLKTIMKGQEVFLVSGHLLDTKGNIQSLSSCML